MKKFPMLAALALAFVASLLYLESDTPGSSVAESAVLDADHESIFSFLLHPDTVEMWFRWISHLRSADMKPLGPGKRYLVTYTLPAVGDYVLLFRVSEFTPGRRIVLESDSILRPRVEISSAPLANGKAQLTFRFTFRRTSALFQYTLGPVLRHLAQGHARSSLALLASTWAFASSSAL